MTLRTLLWNSGRGAAIVGLAAAMLLICSTGARAAGCYGDYCSGQDPQAMGCSADAYTVASILIPGTGAYVELRWSPSCKANWARVPSGFGAYYPSQLYAIQCATGYTQRGVVASSGGYSWTRMIYSPVKTVRAAWIGVPGSTSTACG
jgi:hypothetical protein